MASKNEVESTSKNFDNVKQDINQEEDENDMEFPFDLSEWMVIDADDDDNETDSSSAVKHNPSTPVKSCTRTSQSKEHCDSYKTTDTHNRRTAASKKSPPGHASSKKEVSSGGSSSAETSALGKYQLPSRSSSRKNTNAIPDQGSKNHSKQVSVNKTSAKHGSLQSRSVSSSKSSSPVTKSDSSHSPIAHAGKNPSERKDHTSVSMMKSASPKDNPKASTQERRSAGSCNFRLTKDGKTAVQQSTKGALKDSKKRTTQTPNQNTKSLPPKSSATPAQRAALPPTAQAAGNTISTQEVDSINQTLKSSCPEPVMLNATSSKKDQDVSGAEFQTSEEVSGNTSQQGSKEKTNTESPVTEHFSVSSATSTVSGTSALTAHPNTNSSGSTFNKRACSQTESQRCRSTGSLSNTTTDTASKAVEVSPDLEKGNQEESSFKGVKSIGSDSSQWQVVKGTESVLLDKESRESDVNKTKSPSRQSKLSRTTDLLGGIAEAMEAGDLDLEDIQVFDLDSDDRCDETRVPQTKSVPNAGPTTKKRPAQTDGEGTTKKAKYAERKSEVSSQDPKALASKQNEKTKMFQAGGKELTVNKENAKKIVRRFHRTTQTVSKSLSHKLSQCSIGSSTSRSTTKRQASLGVQCNIGESHDDVTRLVLNSDSFPVDSSIKQEVFKAVLAFDVSSLHPDTVAPGVFKYGIRIGHVTQSDVDKTLLKDNFVKKADRYTISFLEKEFGIFDLLFHEEENFVSVYNQIRRLRIGQRYLCVTVVKTLEEGDIDPSNLCNYLKATVVFDQNYDSMGYLSYYKSPLWSKPKVDEFVTLHNVPDGVPLSFLGLVFPDAISILMRDVKLKFTRKSSGVRLGMNRKNGSEFVVKLYTQVLINNTPVFLTQGLTDRKDVIDKKGFSKLLGDLEKLEREKQKEKSHDRTLTAKARNIGDTKKIVTDRTRETGNVPQRKDSFMKKDQAHRMSGTQQDVSSDLSDISELSFNASNFDNSKDDLKPPERRGQRHFPKKTEPKKSLSLAMGSKLLSRARNKVHQTQSRQRNDEKLNDNRMESLRTRRDPDMRRDVVSRRGQTLLELPKNVREVERNSRDGSNKRRSNSQQRERSRIHYSREDHLTDRSTPRHGQWNQRGPEINRLRNERSLLDQHSRNKSNNRSSERDMPNRKNSDRIPRSSERHISRENRSGTREGDAFGGVINYGHSIPKRNSHEREIFLGKPKQMASDLKRSSEDLRTILESKRPKEARISPRNHGSTDRNRHGSPARRQASQERRKRPRSRSPSPNGRKVIIRRRSLSPKNRSGRGRSNDLSQPLFPVQPSRPGRDSMPGKFLERNDQESQNTQSVMRPFDDSAQQESGEGSMTISKSLFVKLLTNALHSEEEGVNNSQMPGHPDKGFPSLNDDTAKMLSHIRNQETPRCPGDNFDKNRIRPGDNFNKNMRRPSDKFDKNIPRPGDHFDKNRIRSGDNFEKNMLRPGDSFEKNTFRPRDTFEKSLLHEQRRPDFKNERSSYGQPGPSKSDIYHQSNQARPDPKPIPPPVMPPILTSSAMAFQANKPDSTDVTRGLSGPQMSQGVWAVPPPTSFNLMSEGRPVPPPPTTSNPPLQSSQIQNRFPLQAPMMFSRPPPTQPPPFLQSQGQGPNIAQAIHPRPTGMWQNHHSRPF